jgi:hypothetical protein
MKRLSDQTNVKDTSPLDFRAETVQIQKSSRPAVTGQLCIVKTKSPLL